MKWLKSLFKPKVTQVTSIQAVLPLYGPETCTIEVRKGVLSPEELEKLQKGDNFEFNGTSKDFVVLPKTQQKET